MSNSPDISRRDWIMVVALGVIWGSTFLVIEIALRGITPFWLASARIVFASALVGLFWLAKGARLFSAPVSPGTWVLLIVTGALSTAVPFLLISWGQQFVTSGFTGVSMASVALMVLPLAHFLVPGEQLSWRKALGFVVGFAGVVVLIGGQAFESSGNEAEIWGRLACLSAAACYAVSSVMLRKLPPADPVGLTAVTLLIGLAPVLAVALTFEGLPPAVDAPTFWALAILGLIPTAGAFLLRIMVVLSAGPTFMSLTNYQVPIWSVIMGWLVLSEPLPPSLIWALLLILGGVGLSQYGALTRLFRR
ncbi:putative DMT superfamily transporter inner membrane protein [Falsiruegeria litorea R37]|uniref:Putative DMT superfamily transporter inner membrane protein n=1 Tax=Falsiruegeria litorea R37 TaxID=1200284 RepID=A0A1Y5TBY4_9RHOB|nr:DMT family transporter [Falsiruegeria litorea]SLN58444.1 putative DMT superfamily transporter inner membrane protein [Falsiruegeria litorea R37]